MNQPTGVKSRKMMGPLPLEVGQAVALNQGVFL